MKWRYYIQKEVLETPKGTSKLHKWETRNLLAPPQNALSVITPLTPVALWENLNDQLTEKKSFKLRSTVVST